MLNIGKKELKDLAEAFAGHLADEFNKKVGFGGKKFNPGSGRGGNANSLQPDDPQGYMNSSGSIKATKTLTKSLDSLVLELSKQRMFGNRTKTAESMRPGSTTRTASNNFDLSLLDRIIPSRIINRKKEEAIDNLTKNAAELVDKNNGPFKDLAKKTLDYIRNPNTDLKKLDEVTNDIDDLRRSLHQLHKTGNLNNRTLTMFADQMALITDHSDEQIDIFGALSKETQELIKSIREGKTTFDQANDKHVGAVAEISSALENAGNSISEVSMSVSENMQKMIDDIHDRWKTARIAFIASLSFGAVQFAKDITSQYNTLMPRNFWVENLLGNTGLSTEDVFVGISQYRQTLREAAIRNGVDFYDYIGGMLRDGSGQDLGESIGLSGEAAWQFTLKLRDSVRNLGLAASPSSYAAMLEFYKDSALLLGKTTEEFAEEFSNLASDPLMISMVNNLLYQGEKANEAFKKEMTSRMRMNKLLGMTNEQLMEQIRLEQKQSYLPLEQKIRESIGKQLLAQSLNMNLSTRQREILDRGTMSGRNALTPNERAIYDTLKAEMNLREVEMRMGENDYVRGSPGLNRDAQVAGARELRRHFMDMAGSFTTQEEGNLIERQVRALEEMGLSRNTVFQKLRGTMDLTADEKAIIDKLTGEAAERPPDDGWRSNIKDITTNIQNIRDAIINNPLLKMGLGLLGIIAAAVTKMAFGRWIGNIITGSGGFGGTITKVGSKIASAVKWGATALFRRLGPVAVGYYAHKFGKYLNEEHGMTLNNLVSEKITDKIFGLPNLYARLKGAGNPLKSDNDFLNASQDSSKTYLGNLLMGLNNRFEDVALTSADIQHMTYDEIKKNLDSLQEKWAEQIKASAENNQQTQERLLQIQEQTMKNTEKTAEVTKNSFEQDKKEIEEKRAKAGDQIDQLMLAYSGRASEFESYIRSGGPKPVV